MAEFYPLTAAQTASLIEILDNPIVEELMEVNDWYNQFVPSMRIDIIRRQVVSERQLYQIHKLAELTKQQWRVII